MPTTPTPPPAPTPVPTGSAGLAGVVPMAVWPTVPVTTEPVDLTCSIPALLAKRLVAVYTHPSDTVLAAGVGAPTVAAVARELGRHPTTATGPARSGRARLVVLTLGALSTDPAHLASWATHLLPSGLLAAVVPNAVGAGAVLCGRVVEAASRAGLGYLQHVVAITARLVDDRLDPHPTDREIGQALAARAAGLPAHLPVHADVLIFHRGQTAGRDAEVGQ